MAEKWKTLDPEVRQEILRRERDVTKSFGENNQVREFHKQFSEVVRPFEARLRATGISPLQAVSELFKADYILSSSPATQKAQYMAKLVKEYGVDIRELDAALAGEAAPDPVASRVEQMLAERLAPYQQFMNQQREYAQQREAQVQQEAGATIEQMAADSVKFPYFDQVREDMADIIELGAKRGLYFSPEQAYTRAVAMNPEWNAQMVAQQQAAAQMSQAQAANAKAQKALGAAASVSGAPGGSPAGVNPNGSLRDTIEAAWSQVAGR
jgi:DNA-binding ferritin-like protein